MKAERAECDGSDMPRKAVWVDAGLSSVPNDFGKPTLSDRALLLINGPRQDSYASPEVNLSRIGDMWGAILGQPDAVESWRVALMFAAVKIARAAHKPEDDSLIDAVGYLELVERLR